MLSAVSNLEYFLPLNLHKINSLPPALFEEVPRNLELIAPKSGCNLLIHLLPAILENLDTLPPWLPSMLSC